MKVAYVFPGQGSQFRGMGSDLFGVYPQQVAEASSILGYSISKLCLEDPDHKLSQTQYTQPALFVVNALAYLRRSEAASSDLSFAAGHSLGEYNALHAAGVFDFSTGVRLVKRRGELMSSVQGGGMSAILGLPPYQVSRILQDAALSHLSVANFNSYKQSVVAGPEEQLDRAETTFTASGASRVVRLNVSAPFHSSYMHDVEAEFRIFLETQGFAAPAFPVISNASALPYAADRITQTLASQISRPVRWIECVEYLMRQRDVDFVEVGPGSTLTRLVSEIKEQSAFAS